VFIADDIVQDGYNTHTIPGPYTPLNRF